MAIELIELTLATPTIHEQMFYQFAKKAHYFYYIKLRLATCMPSKCDKNDLELLGKQGKHYRISYLSASIDREFRAG